jgi:hypothetical protein
MYPLEMLYHTLLLAQLYALMRRRYGAATLWFTTACLSNPYLGLQVLGLQAGALLLSIRNRSVARRWIRVSAAVAVGFVLYYQRFLPADPMAQSIIVQHRVAFDQPLSLHDFLIGHGAAVALLVFSVLISRTFRHDLLHSRRLRPVLVLLAWTALLVENGRASWFSGLEPMHFTRGYLFLGLWLLAFFGLRRVGQELPQLRKFATAAAIAVCVLVIPDNVIFLTEQWRVPPGEGHLFLNDTTAELARFLQEHPQPRRIATFDLALSEYLAGIPNQWTMFGTPLTTPFFAEQCTAFEEFFKRGAWGDIGVNNRIDTVIISTAETSEVEALARNPEWSRTLANAEWQMFTRRPRSE